MAVEEASDKKMVMELVEVENTMNVSDRVYIQNNISDWNVNRWCRKRKYTRYIVPFGCDSLFRCTAKALMLTNVNFDFIKKKVCEYLEKNRFHYEMRVKLMYAHEQSIHPNWLIYKRLQDLTPFYNDVAGRAQDVWDAHMYRLIATPNGGGIIEAEIISMIFNCKVYIFRDLINAPFKFIGNGETPPKEKIRLLSLKGKNHFDLLQSEKDLVTGGACQSLVYESLYKGTFGNKTAVADSQECQSARQNWDHRTPFATPKHLDFPRAAEGCLDPDQMRNPSFRNLRNARNITAMGPNAEDVDAKAFSKSYSFVEYFTDYQNRDSSGRLLQPIEFSFSDYWEMLGRGSIVVNQECKPKCGSELVEMDVFEDRSRDFDDESENENCKVMMINTINEISKPDSQI